LRQFAEKPVSYFAPRSVQFKKNNAVQNEQSGKNDMHVMTHGLRARRASAAVALFLLLALTFGAAKAQDKTYVMKLGTATINEGQHEWCKRFAAMVEKDSGGRIKGEIYPASQLGPIPREIEGVQFGEI
jgi:hypothetical protein